MGATGPSREVGRIAALLAGIDLACLEPEKGLPTTIDWPIVVVTGFDGSPDRCARLSQLRVQLPDKALVALIPGDDVAKRLLAFEYGADEVFDSAGDIRELRARIDALGRLIARTVVPLHLGSLLLDPLDRRVERDQRRIRLRQREFDVLHYLARHADRYVPLAKLREDVWGLAFDPGTNSVAVHISRLRRLIDHGFGWRMIRSERDLGYALASAPDATIVA